MNMKIEDLEQIIKILKQNDVNEFEFDNDGVRIRLTRGGQIAVSSVRSNGTVDIQPTIFSTLPVNGSGAQEAAYQNGDAPAPREDLSKFSKVESPIVGTFYRRPAPDAEPFVTEGATVKKGDTLCIIEAMKLMNEIEAPCSGKVQKVLLNDGQVVEYGEVLFLIDPNV